MSEVQRVVIPAAETGPEAPKPEVVAPAGERPAWLPEKFKTPEDFAKSYAELEKKQGTAKPEGETPAAEEKPAAEPKADDDPAALKIQEAADVLTVAGLNMTTFTAEWEKDGKISEASYKTLEEKGFPKAVVDTYIAGIQAAATVEAVQAEKHVGDVMSITGGADGYKQMATWASQNLSQSEIEAFDSVMDEGDVGKIKLAVTGLKARMDAAEGVEPGNLQNGKGGNTTDVFTSTAQVTAAMKDPRYKKDAAYRAQVEQKVMRSTIL